MLLFQVKAEEGVEAVMEEISEFEQVCIYVFLCGHHTMHNTL